MQWVKDVVVETQVEVVHCSERQFKKVVVVTSVDVEVVCCTRLSRATILW